MAEMDLDALACDQCGRDRLSGLRRLKPMDGTRPSHILCATCLRAVGVAYSETPELLRRIMPGAGSRHHGIYRSGGEYFILRSRPKTMLQANGTTRVSDAGLTPPPA